MYFVILFILKLNIKKTRPILLSFDSISSHKIFLSSNLDAN